MKVLALDLSLTSTGYALPTGVTGVIKPPKTAERGMDRLRMIRDRIRQMLGGVQLVVIEGYSYGSMNKREALGELGGVVRMALFDVNMPYVDVQPSSLKLYATGKGNASKELVLAQAIRRLHYAGSDNNEADALWLRAMALDYYGDGKPMPQKQRAALDAVEWPARRDEDAEKRRAMRFFDNRHAMRGDD